MEQPHIEGSPELHKGVNSFEKDLYKLVLITKKYDINSQTIGVVNNKGKLIINDLVDVNKDVLCETYYNTLDKIMTK